MSNSQKENYSPAASGESSSMISELTIMPTTSQQDYNDSRSQSSGEKTREDVNIQYCSKKPKPHGNNTASASKRNNNYKSTSNTTTTTTTPSYLRGDAKDDRELERALLASQQVYRDQLKRAEDEKAQLERAMRESLAVARSSRQPQVYSIDDDDDDEVVVIDDDDDEKMPAKRAANNATSANNDQDNMDDIQKAIRLSLEEQNKKIEISNDETNDDGDEFRCRVLSRKEFEDVIYPLAELQGGFQKIEKGKLVQMGNGAGEVKNSKAQSRAQYGRYMIEDFWRVFDVLEGKIDTKNDNSVSGESEGKIKADCTATPTQGEKEEEGQNQNNSPRKAGSKITALTDIGHGIGLQVMQAGWTLDVCARGIELMEGRHEIAKAIREGVIDELRNDPPDATKVDLRLDNLVHCVLPPSGKSKRDEELRRFVLFQDKPEETQRGLVIFANNAEDVFAARSNDSGNGACLDEHLAELFGNMKVGGRCVTLTDIRQYLTSKEDERWYSYESFDSGVGAVSWSPNKSVLVHILTKISDDWKCSNEKYVCPPTNVVDVETGRLTTNCLYCGEAPRRQQQRNRRKRKIFSPDAFVGRGKEEDESSPK